MYLCAILKIQIMDKFLITKELGRTLGVLKFIKDNIVETREGVKYLVKTAMQTSDNSFIVRYKMIT